MIRAYLLASGAALLAAPAALAQRASPSPSPSPKAGSAMFALTSYWAVPGCAGLPNSVDAIMVPAYGICPPDARGCVSTAGANATSVFYGACAASVPAPLAAQPAAPPLVPQPVPGTVVVSRFMLKSCAAGQNQVEKFNVFQLGVCVNQTRAIYSCIGSSTLVSLYNSSTCAGTPYTTQLWPAGCVNQLPSVGIGSTFVSGCQTARGAGRTYNPETNASNVQAALIVPLTLGCLILIVRACAPHVRAVRVARTETRAC
jgi:hypothetical protein